MIVVSQRLTIPVDLALIRRHCAEQPERFACVPLQAWAPRTLTAIHGRPGRVTVGRAGSWKK